MLLVIQVDLVIEHSLLAPLQHKHRSGPVENRHVIEHGLTPQQPHALKPRGIVAMAGSKPSGKFDHFLPPRDTLMLIHRN